MFERFTDPARRAVVVAQEEARERRAGRIGPEHLLLGILRCPATPGEELLRAAGVGAPEVGTDLARDLADDLAHDLDHDRARARPDDADALATLGIDLDEVRRAAEESFGPGALDRTGRRRGRWSAGHIPFDRLTKKALELALREAVRLGDRHIGTEHVLLGLLHPDHAASRILTGRGMTLEGTRRTVAERQGRRAG